MGSVLIRGGNVVRPESDFVGKADILLKDGVIAKVAKKITDKAECVIDAEGLTVMPGLVDMHVHFRDPGQTYKEDIESGARAAAHGGVTSVLAMPNTKPVMDDPDRIRYVVNKAASVAKIHVYQAGAITKGMKNEEITDIDGMVSAGAKAVSEDGKSVMNTEILRNAMRKAAKLGIPVCSHCEDPALVRGGVMNMDENAERLGLPGIINASEDIIVARDMILARACGCHLHLCHCSTKGAAELVKIARAADVRISAETCPHYLVLTSDDIPSDDGLYKMNPPLRTKEDRDAIRAAVADDTIDVIVTDHAPHAMTEKGGGFKNAAFGIVGLETSAALIYTELVKPGVISLLQMAKKMSMNPAKILGIPAGTLAEGAPADIAVFDFEAQYAIDPEQFLSKGKNTPFAGRKVFGRTMYTICCGEVVYADPSTETE